jgi:hypothetical protein
LTATTALAAGLLYLVRVSSAPPAAASSATGTVVAITALMLLYRVVNPPDDLGRELGLWLGLIATFAVGVGAYLGMQDTGLVEDRGS